MNDAANDSGHGHSGYPRSAPRDIAALLRSGHVEAGGALPIQQRVQTSGRGDPRPPHWSAEGERAQRILGRGYAEGGDARRCALALWLLHASSVDVLLIGLGVLLRTDEERRRVVREWTRWGVGGSANSLAESAVELLGRAVGWYEEASEEPGHAGVFCQLVATADGISDRHGVLERMREWHANELATRTECAGLARRVRCTGPHQPRNASVDQPRCNERPFSWSPPPGRIDRKASPTCRGADGRALELTCATRRAERRAAA